MIIEKDVYLREVKKLVKTYENRLDVTETLGMFEEVYKYATGEKRIDGEASIIVDKLLKKLFKLPTTYMIPGDFIDSPIGRVLFSVKFWRDEEMYTSADLVAIMNITRALVSHDLAEENLIGQRIGRKRNIYIYKSDLIKYMASKGIPHDEIEKRISVYKKCQNQNLDYEKRKEIMSTYFGKNK